MESVGTEKNIVVYGWVDNEKGSMFYECWINKYSSLIVDFKFENKHFPCSFNNLNEKCENFVKNFNWSKK